jgi:hypothetical protein
VIAGTAHAWGNTQVPQEVKPMPEKNTVQKAKAAALKREPKSSGSKPALSRHAKRAARKRTK